MAPGCWLWYVSCTLRRGKDLKVCLLQGFQMLHGSKALRYGQQLAQSNVHMLNKGYILIHQVDYQQLQSLCQDCLEAVHLHRMGC